VQCAFINCTRSYASSFVFGNNEGTLLRRSIDGGRLAIILGSSVYCFVESEVHGLVLFAVVSVCVV